MIFNEIFPYSTVASVAMVTCKEPQCPWRSMCILPVTAIMMASEAIAAFM